jgi:hypothetical protein
MYASAMAGICWQHLRAVTWRLDAIKDVAGRTVANRGRLESGVGLKDRAQDILTENVYHAHQMKTAVPNMDMKSAAETVPYFNILTFKL